jgi:hypothetical protein
MDLRKIEDIRANGFEGFVSVTDLRLSGCRAVPRKPGVYLVLRPSSAPPQFLPQSTGGRHKGKDPTVAVDLLRDKWVDGALVLNIGKAGAIDKDATLKSRLGAYMNFGLGKQQGHTGGRYIWQLRDACDLLLCWKQTAKADARGIESKLIREFEQQHNGRLPFANLCH